MPLRVGFSMFRKDMLERELKGIETLLPSLGVERVILVGDMITGQYTQDSAIQLVVVHETDRPFGRRADFFSYHLNTGVAVDFQVYTPDEFDELREKLPVLNQVCKLGRVIFEA